jgi:hypothetical protein
MTARVLSYNEICNPFKVVCHKCKSSIWNHESYVSYIHTKNKYTKMIFLCGECYSNE